jgi:hypothetical protein
MSSKRGGAGPGAGRKPGKVGAAKQALADKAAVHADAALQTLADIAKDGESEASRVSAAIAILDRAYGRPPQAVHLSGEDGGSIKLEDVSAAREELTRRVSGLAARAGEAEGTRRPN